MKRRLKLVQNLQNKAHHELPGHNVFMYYENNVRVRDWFESNISRSEQSIALWAWLFNDVPG